MKRAKKKLPTGPINIAAPRTPQTRLKQETSISDDIKKVSSKPETRKQESSYLVSDLEEGDGRELDYKKVAMRLSAISVQKLRSLKSDTGLPYEVIVDTLIKQWDDLEPEFKQLILSSAKEERVRRLVAGQEKATQTTMKRLQNL